MPKRIRRGDFLRTAAPALVASEFAHAGRIWPPMSIAPETSAGPRHFTGCCAYSYSKLLGAGKMAMEDVIREAVELGIDGVDMTAYWFKSTDLAYLVSLRHLAFKNGVCFSGAATGASTVQAEPGKRVQVVEEIKKWIDVTESLADPHLRVFAGKLPGEPLFKGIQWTVDTLKVACDYAGQKGVTLGREDHEGITQNSDTCLEIVHRIDSPFFGINLDITNFFHSHCCKLTLTCKSKPRSLMPRILTSATTWQTGKQWTSTAYGSFLQSPITKVSGPRNMKAKRIPRPAWPSRSTKSQLFAGDIPQCNRGVKRC